MFLGEYHIVSNILEKVCELQFQLEEVEESEDCSPDEFLTLSMAEEDGMVKSSIFKNKGMTKEMYNERQFYLLKILLIWK